MTEELWDESEFARLIESASGHLYPPASEIPRDAVTGEIVMRLDGGPLPIYDVTEEPPEA